MNIRACVRAALLVSLSLLSAPALAASCAGYWSVEVPYSRSTEIGASGTYTRVMLAAGRAVTSPVSGPLSRAYLCPVSWPWYLDVWVARLPADPLDPPTCEGAVIPPVSGGNFILPDGERALLCVRHPDTWPVLAPARVSVELLQSQDATGTATPLVLEVTR